LGGGAPASILDTDELLTAVVNLITERFGFYYAAVFTLDDDGRRAVLRAATGEAGRVLMERQHQLDADERSMVGAAIVRRQARITADVTREGSRFANPLLPKTRSEIALPLQVGRRVLGALDVQSIEPAAFDEATAGVLQSMADQIAVALSNAQQFKQTAAALEQANTLYQASQSMALATDPQTMLTELVRYAAADADRAAIILYGSEQPGVEPHLVAVAAWARRALDLQIAPDARFTMDQLPVMQNLSTAAPLIVADSRQPDIDRNLRRTMRLFKVRAAIVVPMITAQQPFGALIIAYRQPRRFTPDDLRPLTALTNQLAVSIQNQRLLAEAQSALQQLDEANRRLTGEAWRAYTRATPALKAIDIGPGVNAERVTADAATAPIVVRGEPIGVLKLGGVDGHQDGAEDSLALLQAVADEVASVIDNTRLFEQAELRAAREAQLNRITERIRRATSIQAILRTAAEELSAALNTSHAHAQLGRGTRNNDHPHAPAAGQLNSPPLAGPVNRDHNGQEVSA
jgi:GAF domain-containing protein